METRLKGYTFELNIQARGCLTGIWSNGGKEPRWCGWLHRCSTRLVRKTRLVLSWIISTSEAAPPQAEAFVVSGITGERGFIFRGSGCKDPSHTHTHRRPPAVLSILLQQLLQSSAGGGGGGDVSALE